MVAVVGVALAAACVPSDPSSTNEVAVRRTENGEVEVLPCTSHKISKLQAVAIRDAEGEDRHEEMLWAIEFDPARLRTAVILGVVPPGADEVEPWDAAGLVDSSDDRYAVRIWQDDGNNRAQSFQLADLADDAVVFDDQVMTAAEFDDDDCF